jgi:hypothetical protein
MCRRGSFTLHFIIPPPFAFRPLPPHLLPPRPLGHCRRRRRRPPSAVSVAAVSAAATIAVSIDIAAAFWLIVVCPRCCLCFRLPPPFLPAPAIATAAVCRRHCCRHRHRRPGSFCRHRCRRRRRPPPSPSPPSPSPPSPSPPSPLPPRSPFPLILLLLSG